MLFHPEHFLLSTPHIVPDFNELVFFPKQQYVPVSYPLDETAPEGTVTGFEPVFPEILGERRVGFEPTT